MFLTQGSPRSSRRILFSLAVLIFGILFSNLALVKVKAIEKEVIYFSDLDDYKYEDEVYYLANGAIVSGYPDGTFKPNRVLNRAELLKIVVLSFYDEDELASYEGKKCFPDLDSDQWYAKYVCFAKAKSIVGGYPDGTFRPAQAVNYVEALKIALEIELKSESASDDSSVKFKADSNQVWYQKYQTEAKDRDLEPFDLTSLDSNFSRGQTAFLVARLLGYYRPDEVFSQSVTESSLVAEDLVADDSGYSLNNEDFLAAINQFRSANGKAALELDPKMSEAALGHANWMNENNFLSHTDADGASYDDRCEAVGVFCLAENIAVHLQPSVENFLDLWIGSAPHKANLLGDYTKIGIGVSGKYAVNVFGN